MSDTIKVAFAPEFIQRALDWADVPADVSQAEDGQFNITLRGDRTNTEVNVIGVLTSAIIGLYLSKDENAPADPRYPEL